MRPRALHPLWNLFLGALCFVALDMLLFKLGPYHRIASRNALSVDYAEGARALAERRKLASDPDEALVLGDSAVGEDLWPELAEPAFPSAPLRMVKASFSDLSPRAAYYVLRAIDPRHDRYPMIVVPLPFYEGAPEFDMQPHDSLDIEALAPTLALHDYLDFAFQFGDVERSTAALCWRIFGSPGYADDFRDLLTAPQRRFAELDGAPEPGPATARPFESRSATMVGLGFDPISRVVRYPPGVDRARKKTIDRFYRFVPPEELAHKAAVSAKFVREWLGRIVADYRGGHSLVVFLRMPTRPTRLPALEPPPGAPSVIDSFRGEPHVEIIDAGMFDNLERPDYFWDMRHLNLEGRAEFSKQLLKVLLEVQRRRLGGDR